VLVSNAPGIVVKKLGQPVPLSYFTASEAVPRRSLSKKGLREEKLAFLAI